MELIKKYYQWILFFIVIILSLFIRFYNFENRINFGPEQGLTLLVSGDYIRNGFSLVGMPNFQRFTISGHNIFSGAIFNYLLVPFMVVLNYDPLPITALYTLLNISVGIILFYFVKLTINYKVALLSLIIFLFNDYMIYHSMFILNANFAPVLGVLTVIFFYFFKKYKREKYVLLMGIMSGLGVNIFYPYIFTLLFLLIILLWVSDKKLKVTGIYFIGCLIGNFPMVIFELRNNFYTLRTILEYSQETANRPSQNGISYYHFLQFWPVLSLLLGWLICRVYNWRIYLGLLLVGFYLVFNFSSSKISFSTAVGMNEGMSYYVWDKAAQIIADDNFIKQYNVASLIDFDSRAHPLRYLIKYRYGLEPLGNEQYTNLDTLYVFALNNYDFNQAIAYEINAYKPFDIATLKRINNDFMVYKLTKKR